MRTGRDFTRDGGSTGTRARSGVQRGAGTHQFENLGSTDRTALLRRCSTMRTARWAQAGLPAVTAPAPAPAVVANTATSTNPEEATSPITP